MGDVVSVRESSRGREPENKAPPDVSPIVVMPKMEESEVTIKQERRSSGRVLPTGAESGAPQNPIQLDSSLSAVRYFFTKSIAKLREHVSYAG